MQTRSHLEVCQELGHLDVTVYARRAASGAALVEWAAEHAPGCGSRPSAPPAEAVRDAGVIVTGLPIGVEGALLDPATVRDDALLLPLDWGTSVGADIGNAARLFADDVPQFARISERGSSRATAPRRLHGQGARSGRARRAASSARTSARAPPTYLFGNAVAENAERDAVGTLLER